MGDGVKRPAAGERPPGPYDAAVPDGTAGVSPETTRNGAWAPPRAHGIG